MSMEFLNYQTLIEQISFVKKKKKKRLETVLNVSMHRLRSTKTETENMQKPFTKNQINKKKQKSTL